MTGRRGGHQGVLVAMWRAGGGSGCWVAGRGV